MRRFQRQRDGARDEKRLFPSVGGLVRNNNSSLGLETSQLGRKKPFLPKLLAGKPRLGTPGACGGVQGKRLRWECLRDPPPSRCSLRGVQLQGDTPGLSPSGTRGHFSLPNSSQRSELKLRESLAAGGGGPGCSRPLPTPPEHSWDRDEDPKVQDVFNSTQRWPLSHRCPRHRSHFQHRWECGNCGG